MWVLRLHIRIDCNRWERENRSIRSTKSTAQKGQTNKEKAFLSLFFDVNSLGTWIFIKDVLKNSLHFRFAFQNNFRGHKSKALPSRRHSYVGPGPTSQWQESFLNKVPNWVFFGTFKRSVDTITNNTWKFGRVTSHW